MLGCVSLRVIVLLLCCCVRCWSASLFSNVFGDHMVLQASPYKAVVWGWAASANEQVKVAFDSQEYTATSDGNARWQVELPPTAASITKSYTITATSSGITSVLEDVLFGDVYLCGGQSNMQFTLSQVFNASIEIEEANAYPFIRLFTVGQATISDTPLRELKTIEQPWSVASAKTVGGINWQYFSAVCWLHAKYLVQSVKIPLGLISSNWGGTYIQSWMSPEALKTCGATENSRTIEDFYPPEYFSPLHAAPPNQSSVLWNAMIVPFLSMRLRGVVWYQGEQNYHEPDLYAACFPVMIVDWRKQWVETDNEFVFLFVQLAPWTAYSRDLVARTREAQLKALSLPFVGFATAVDLGDIDSPFYNVHPRNKQTVGLRLSLSSRHFAYGDTTVIYQGPTFESWTPLSSTTASINFTIPSIASGLMFVNAECPQQLKNTTECEGFQLQTPDGVWRTAIAKLGSNRNEIILGLANPLPPTIEHPLANVIGVRYGFSDWPVMTLYNKEGLPAIPFSQPPATLQH